MEDISNLHCKLIGINCLTQTEGETVRNLWLQRFHQRSAFWVDATPGASADTIFDQICQSIRGQQIRAMNNETCIIALFLDCTQDVDRALIQAVTRLPNLLQGGLGCHVSLVYQFAWLGTMAPSGRKALRERILALSQTNAQNYTTRRQICLVAQPPLSASSREQWKATVVCLDLLRRKSSPDDILPTVGTGGANNDVGFLRYGEFDDEKLRQLTGRQTRLIRSLSDDGEREFREALTSTFRNLGREIELTIRPDGRAQPLHPGLFVTGWLKRKKAAKNTNAEFSEAQRLTQEAILSTGKAIAQQCLVLAKEACKDASALLRQLLDGAAVGIALEEKRQEMRRLLDQGLQRVDIPTIPTLRYNEDGYTPEIHQYFQDMLRYGTYEAKACLEKALRDAYEAIPDSSFTSRRTQYQQELDAVRHELKYTVQEDEFCRSAQRNGELLQAGFAPQSATTGGVTRRHLLCRSQETAQRLDATYGRPELRISLINGTAAGLKTIDSAPVKALHILTFDCTWESLQDLITEVG